MARSLGALLAFALPLLAVASPALAVPIPPPVAAMIDAAASDANHLGIVADVAKKTNPGSLAEIDARVAVLRAEAEKRRVTQLASLSLREGWKGQGEVGAAITTGNTDESSARLALDLNKETLQRRHRITGLVDSRSTSGVQTAQRYFASYQGDYKFDDRLYANLLASYEHDPFAGLDDRFSQSAGVGYRFLASGPMTLDIDVGLAARQTRYLDTGDEATVGVRSGVRYEWRLKRDTVLSQVASVYLDNRSDTVESATSVTTRLIGHLSWRGSLNVRYESDPPPPLETTDTQTRFSLVYGF